MDLLGDSLLEASPNLRFLSQLLGMRWEAGNNATLLGKMSPSSVYSQFFKIQELLSMEIAQTRQFCSKFSLGDEDNELLSTSES